MYAYGHDKFLENIEEMGIKISSFMKYYFLATWKVVTPLVSFFVLIMNIIQYSPAYSPSYTQENYIFPVGIQCMGWLMALVPVAFIILGCVQQFFKRKFEGQPMDAKSMLTPSLKWGSALVTKAVTPPSALGLDNHNYVQDSLKL